MYNWTKWIWPGIVVTAFLTVMAVWFSASALEMRLNRAADRQLSQNFPWASVHFHARDAILTGTSPAEADIEAALTKIRGLNGVRTARSEADLLPLVSPYEVAVEKNGAEISVSGTLPSAQAKNEAFLAISQKLPGLALVDNVALGRGAPNQLVAALTYAAHGLGFVSVGKFEIKDEEITMEGTALSAADGRILQNDLKSQLPENFRLAESRIHVNFVRNGENNEVQAPD